MGEQALDAENAPAQNRDVEQAREVALERLFVVDLQPLVSALRERDMTALADAALEFGTVLELVCPSNRDKAMAWTALEDALIRGRRSIAAGLR